MYIFVWTKKKINSSTVLKGIMFLFHSGSKMLSLGELLLLFPQYISMIMPVVSKRSNHIGIGCSKCTKNCDILHIPSDYIMGVMVMLSRTYPDAPKQESLCMWYNLPLENAMPNKVFTHTHSQVPFSLRDDCEYVISIFIGFINPNDDCEMKIMDCWVRLGYTIRSLDYEQRMNLVKELGFATFLFQTDRDNKTGTSMWSVLNQNKYIRYVWIPTEVDKFTLLTTPEGNLYDSEGSELLHECWDAINKHVTRNTTITAAIIKCKRNSHQLRVFKMHPSMTNILRVPTIFVK